MHLDLVPSHLLALLDCVRPARGHAKLNPVLGAALLRVRQGALEAAATNLDVSLQTRLPLEGFAPEDTPLCAVPLDECRAAVAALAREDILTLTTTETRMVVAGGRARYTLPLLRDASWPNLLADEAEVPVPTALTGAALARLLRHVLPAADEPRPGAGPLAGVHLRPSGTALIAAATNRYLFLRTILPDAVGDGAMAPVTIPVVSAEQIAATFADVGALTLGVTPLTHVLVIRSQHTEYACRVFADPYPDVETLWARVTETAPAATVTFPLAQCDAALAQVMALAQVVRHKASPVELTFGEETRLRYGVEDVGASQTTLHSLAGTGEPGMRYQVNGEYLSRALTSAALVPSGEEPPVVRLGGDGGKRPLRLSLLGEAHWGAFIAPTGVS